MADEQKIKNLVWIDLEMTGLDPFTDKILQIAILVTDKNLNILDENGLSLFIGIEKSDVDLMSEFVKNLHTKNGIIEKCLNSKLTLEEAEKQVLDYISKYVDKWESPLCGNSITTDRMFIKKNMLKLHEYLHYRCIDVSTIKQLNSIWNNENYKKENDKHEAMGDIIESIEEMKFYKNKLFKN